MEKFLAVTVIWEERFTFTKSETIPASISNAKVIRDTRVSTAFTDSVFHFLVHGHG